MSLSLDNYTVFIGESIDKLGSLLIRYTDSNKLENLVPEISELIKYTNPKLPTQGFDTLCQTIAKYKGSVICLQYLMDAAGVEATVTVPNSSTGIKINVDVYHLRVTSASKFLSLLNRFLYAYLFSLDTFIDIKEVEIPVDIKEKLDVAPRILNFVYGTETGVTDTPLEETDNYDFVVNEYVSLIQIKHPLINKDLGSLKLFIPRTVQTLELPDQKLIVDDKLDFVNRVYEFLPPTRIIDNPVKVIDFSSYYDGAYAHMAMVLAEKYTDRFEVNRFNVYEDGTILMRAQNVVPPVTP